MIAVTPEELVIVLTAGCLFTGLSILGMWWVIR